MRLLPALLCALLAAVLGAAENPAVANFKKAMAGDDPYAKRDAILALADKSVDDQTAYPLLVQAVADRQGHDPAVTALRTRTGLKPPTSSKTGSRYPGYPASDAAADWQAWLAERSKDEEIKRKLDKLDAKPAKPTDPVKSAGGEPAPAAEPPADVPPAPRIPTDDLGKVDRIVYKSGRSLIAYVRSKRLDADGNLVSVRVVHQGGAGEEVIDASTIARIEEDIE